MSGGEKLLVVGPSWVGDMVMAQSLYAHLAATRDDPAIDVLAPPWSLPVLARMPEVRRGIEVPVGHGELGLAARRALGRRLRVEGYDQAIVLPRSFKAALVPFLARIPRRTGFRGEWRYGLINDRRPFDRALLDQTVLRFVALGEREASSRRPQVRAPRLRVDADNLAALEERLSLAGDREVVAMMPGAEYGPAKRWPIERFADVAAELTAQGAAVWVLGSRKERPLGERIAAAGPRVRNLCGATTLVDVVDLLSAARVAVTNDSGLMHVAAAAGAHVVAIYGSSSPGYTPALTERRTVLYEGVPCSPCFQRTCPLHHLRCLLDIPAGAVLAATLDALRGAR